MLRPLSPIINSNFTEMSFESDDEIPGSSQNTVRRGERGLLKEFIPVLVFNQRTLERMKKMKCLRRRGVAVNYCQQCNYATKSKADIVKHSRTHSGERPFECVICGEKFRQKGNLTQHLLTHQEGKFKCDQCDYKSTQKCHLVSHLLTHSGVKPHKCDRCEFSATRRADLVIHQRSHTGERPFSCTHCSYKAVTGSLLTVHMRKHTSVKPYACSQCSYTSAHKGNLERHKLAHSGTKPFSCDYCHFKTAQKTYLTKHLKVGKHAPGPSVPL